MKYYISFLYFIFLFAIVKSQTIISNDTAWTLDTVKVYNNVLIENNATLVIYPGTYVEFQGNYSIDVYGKLIARGVQSDSIFFTINDSTDFSDTSTLVGGWGGIRFFENIIDTSQI
ncbi:MAG: hypothetical protein GXO88_11150, partial [Chlorobi bacterium]|nr:hypothetical protein [Chlorobiota bacterium]